VGDPYYQFMARMPGESNIKLFLFQFPLAIQVDQEYNTGDSGKHRNDSQEDFNVP
jgi:hypothetical protein